MMEFYAAYWNYRDPHGLHRGVSWQRRGASRPRGQLQLTLRWRGGPVPTPLRALTIRVRYLPVHRSRCADDAVWLVSAFQEVGHDENNASNALLASLQVSCTSERRWRTSSGSPPSCARGAPDRDQPARPCAANDPAPKSPSASSSTSPAASSQRLLRAQRRAEDQGRTLQRPGWRPSGETRPCSSITTCARAGVRHAPTGGCGIGIDRLMISHRQPQHPVTSSSCSQFCAANNEPLRWNA